MPRKKKKVVWHKKKGRFIPPAMLKPHSNSRDKQDEEQAVSNKKNERIKRFAQSLSEQIKRAAR